MCKLHPRKSKYANFVLRLFVCANQFYSFVNDFEVLNAKT